MKYGVTSASKAKASGETKGDIEIFSFCGYRAEEEEGRRRKRGKAVKA